MEIFAMTTNELPYRTLRVLCDDDGVSVQLTGKGIRGVVGVFLEPEDALRMARIVLERDDSAVIMDVKVFTEMESTLYQNIDNDDRWAMIMRRVRRLLDEGYVVNVERVSGPYTSETA